MNENNRTEGHDSAPLPMQTLRAGIPASAGTSALSSEQVTEIIRSQMMLAKKFPRDEKLAEDKIKKACMRPGFAETALYSYSRGSETICDLNIHAAHEFARCYGNLNFAIVELAQEADHTKMMAYCCDVETNTFETRMFEVPKSRYTNSGTKVLKDPRDIYENNANNGARRMRQCILAMIPADIQDMAIKTIKDTLLKSSKEPMPERLRKMVEAFGRLPYPVSKDIIEKKYGKKTTQFTETEFVELMTIYTTLRDGGGNAADFFDASVSKDSLKTKPAAANKDRDAGAPDENPGNEPAGSAAPTLEQLLKWVATAKDEDALDVILDQANGLDEQGQGRVRRAISVRKGELLQGGKRQATEQGGMDLD